MTDTVKWEALPIRSEHNERALNFTIMKECQVVLLPTKESYIYLEKDILYVNLSNINSKIGQKLPQHLYICSNDEIKEGDLLYSPKYGLQVVKEVDKYSVKTNTYTGDKNFGYTFYSNAGNVFSYFKTDKDFKNLLKVIATTENISYKSLPSIPQQFIIQYIEEYNKGNIITSVMVEYEVKPVYGKKEIRMTDGIDAWESAMRKGLSLPKLNGNEIIINN